MNEASQILKDSAIFSELTDDELEIIYQYLEEKKFLPDEIIVAQGTLGKDLYIIKSGWVTIKVRLPGGYEKIATRLEVGQVFGEMAFLAHQPITATVLVVQPVTCWIFHKHVLEMLRVVYPELAYKIERAIAKQASQKIADHLERIRDLLYSIAINYPLLPGHGRFLIRPESTWKEVDAASINRSLLKKMTIFTSLSDEELMLLLPFMQAKNINKGYSLTQESQTADTINIICAGAVMLFLKDGKKLIKSIAVLKVGDQFLNSHDNDFSRISSYVTCEQCLLLQIDLKNYTRLHRSYPSIFYRISQTLHQSIVKSLYILNREFVRINSEYNDLISKEV